MKKIWGPIIIWFIMFEVGCFVLWFIGRPLLIDGHILYDLMILFLIGYELSVYMPCFKDMKNGKTVSFQGKYIGKKGGLRDNMHFTNCSIHYFTNEAGERECIHTPNKFYSKYPFMQGENYRVSYYKNSHVIYSIERCE